MQTTETWRCVNFSKNCPHIMVGSPFDKNSQVACVCGFWYERVVESGALLVLNNAVELRDAGHKDCN